MVKEFLLRGDIIYLICRFFCEFWEVGWGGGGPTG